MICTLECDCTPLKINKPDKMSESEIRVLDIPETHEAHETHETQEEQEEHEGQEEHEEQEEPEAQEAHATKRQKKRKIQEKPNFQYMIATHVVRRHQFIHAEMSRPVFLITYKNKFGATGTRVLFMSPQQKQVIKNGLFFFYGGFSDKRILDLYENLAQNPPPPIDASIPRRIRENYDDYCSGWSAVQKMEPPFCAIRYIGNIKNIKYYLIERHASQDPLLFKVWKSYILCNKSTNKFDCSSSLFEHPFEKTSLRELHLEKSRYCGVYEDCNGDPTLLKELDFLRIIKNLLTAPKKSFDLERCFALRVFDYTIREKTMSVIMKVQDIKSTTQSFFTLFLPIHICDDKIVSSQPRLIFNNRVELTANYDSEKYEFLITVKTSIGTKTFSFFHRESINFKYTSTITFGFGVGVPSINREYPFKFEVPSNQGTNAENSSFYIDGLYLSA